MDGSKGAAAKRLLAMFYEDKNISRIEQLVDQNNTVLMVSRRILLLLSSFFILKLNRTMFFSFFFYLHLIMTAIKVEVVFYRL